MIDDTANGIAKPLFAERYKIEICAHWIAMNKVVKGSANFACTLQVFLGIAHLEHFGEIGANFMTPPVFP